jgi:hypothetical protein
MVSRVEEGEEGKGGARMAVWKCALIGILLLVRSPSPGLEVQEHDGVKYVTGGVGFDERKELDALSSQFNLKLTLALTNGDFLGDSKVHITSADGATVLDAVTDGPYFYVHVKPGTYTVKIDRDGHVLQRTAHVTGSGQQHLRFSWKEE